MVLLYSFCVLGWILGYANGVPMATAAMSDGEIMVLVESALATAQLEKQEQKNLDIVMLQKGYDEAKGSTTQDHWSAMSQLSDVFSFMKNSSAAQCDKAFLVTRSTLYLAKHLQTSPVNVYNNPRIVRAWLKVFGQLCNPRIVTCPVHTLGYRTIDGSCNNLHHPTWGMANRPQKRNIPSAYDDGVNSPRTRGRSGHPLPSPRAVSNVLHNAIVSDLTDTTDSVMVMQFGQLIDHDFADTPILKGKDGATIECCKLPSTTASRRHACFPISIPHNDVRFRTPCMNFARSGDGTSDSCSLGVRNQLNQLSSYIDASFLYGSDTKNEEVIREHWGGRLLMTKDGFFAEHENPNNCIKEVTGHYCMKAGDRRIHITPILTSTIVMFLRQHNLLADKLAKINPHWSDDQIYQTTRKIVIAITQHITYREYLPSILDPTTMGLYGLKGPMFGYDTSYDANVDATIANSFAVAAFRFGHSQVPNFIQMVDSYHQVYAKNLSETLNRPKLVYGVNGKGYDDLNRWLSFGLGSKSDRFIENSVRNDLLLDPQGNSFDLASLNIQRGRDHGTPGYNAWRQWLNLPTAYRFMSGAGGFTDMDARVVAQLASLYEHPDDVDLFTGGLAERPLPGASVGPTFAGILAQQFKELKVGDRFWYENNFPQTGFTLDQLNSIKLFTLSRMACNTVDIQYLQRNMFKVPGKLNEAVNCITIPDIDITLWKDVKGLY